MPGTLALYTDARSAALSRCYDLSALPGRLEGSCLDPADKAALAAFALVARHMGAVSGLTEPDWRALADAAEGPGLALFVGKGYLRRTAGGVYYPTEALLTAIKADRRALSLRPAERAD